MALDPSNNSNLEQLALKGLTEALSRRKELHECGRMDWTSV